MSQRKRKTGRGGATAQPAAAQAVTAQPAAAQAVTAQAVTNVSTQTAPPPQAPPPAPSRPSAPLSRRQLAQLRAQQRREAASIRAAQAAAHEQHWIERYSARAEAKNAEAREKLVPLGPRDHPWALRVAILIAMVLSLGTLVLIVAGAKVGGKPPATSWFLYVVVMFACGVGMWKHWYQAVLAFMCLLGIALVILCALVVRFSNLLGLVVPLVLIVAGGVEFWKLVGILARLQMPQRPTRSA